MVHSVLDMANTTRPDERHDILSLLAEQRETLLITVRGIDDEQAARRTTVSELTLGGVIKHLAHTERSWIHALTERNGEIPPGGLDMSQYTMAEGETLAGLIAEYAAAAEATETAVLALPSLAEMVPLAVYPWSPPERVSWSALRVLLHLIRETAQHSGHADIIREALDGANTTMQMGVDAGMNEEDFAALGT
jgi:uncharacterized damage-inducible protein DinB